jgi:hypothetical protein
MPQPSPLPLYIGWGIGQGGCLSLQVPPRPTKPSKFASGIWSYPLVVTWARGWARRLAQVCLVRKHLAHVVPPELLDPTMGPLEPSRKLSVQYQKNPKLFWNPKINLSGMDFTIRTIPKLVMMYWIPSKTTNNIRSNHYDLSHYYPSVDENQVCDLRVWEYADIWSRHISDQ